MSIDVAAISVSGAAIAACPGTIVTARPATPAMPVSPPHADRLGIVQRTLLGTDDFDITVARLRAGLEMR